MRVCLDAHAVLAWLQHEAGWERVRDAFEAPNAGAPACLMSAVNVGEVYCVVRRRAGRSDARELWWAAFSGELPIEVVEATSPRVLRAATIKARTPMSYADAFACATALEHGVPILTGDPEILAAREALGLEVVALR